MDDRETVPSLTPEDMLCYDVYALQHAFGRVYAPLLDPLGLTYPQYLVMMVLWARGACSLGAIGRELELESSTLTPLIKRLAAAGLVTRRRDDVDERRLIVALTEEGRALQARAATIPRCVESATGLAPADIAALRTKLGALRRTLLRTAEDRPVA